MDRLNSSDDSVQCRFSNCDKCPIPGQDVNTRGLGGYAVVQERKEVLCATPGKINTHAILVKSNWLFLNRASIYGPGASCTLQRSGSTLFASHYSPAFSSCLQGQFSESASLKLLQASLPLPHWSSSTQLLDPPLGRSLSPF